ncbi:MAG: biotin carboxylase N-terminal domain-containing protein [Candidatus Lustribacter sp.]
MIRRLLVANRGEIAIRIARGARELGIAPVGVYSDADANALFREALDASVRIGPGPAAESYLDGAAIVAAARTLGADTLHPGYGFLSERAPFAQAVLDAGLIFVGPTPAAIAAIGSKSEAKRRVRAAGVPVVGGYDGDDQDDAVLRREAAALGTPLVIKAVAGGGGRGMRVVDDLASFDDALASARREARAAFGDDAVLLERYLHHPRHIEFQILADAHGGIVHLGERDCSIQRRHQKVVEEAPSPALDPALRARMGEAAVTAARSVGYTNAGTVEFLLAEDGTFAFLEMNARLQVEHPVTELVYGVDLVHEQLRIANGEPLRFAQDAVAPRGWAIEVRLNAEDPARDFAPQAGTIATFEVLRAPGVRLDAGVRAGSEVPVFYDSLLAKIIVGAEDRPSAIARLRATLDATRISGIATNLPLLRAIAADDAFAAGEATTSYLDERGATLAAHAARRSAGALLAAAGALLRSGYGWRPGGIGIPLVLEHEGERVQLIADRTAGGWHVRGDLEGDVPHDGPSAPLDGSGVSVVPPPDANAGAATAAYGSGSVSAPMPGKIVSVAVQAGNSVSLHDLLVVLEAMKMEHRIEAPITGTVSAVHVAPGDLVPAGAALVTIGPE